MADIYRTTIFKHGRSEAVRFPKEWGIKVGQWFEITREGDAVVLRMIDEPLAEKKRQ